MTKVKNIKFINKVLPGEKVFIKAEITELNANFLAVSSKAEVYNRKGQKVCKAEISFVIKSISDFQ